MTCHLPSFISLYQILPLCLLYDHLCLIVFSLPFPTFFFAMVPSLSLSQINLSSSFFLTPSLPLYLQRHFNFNQKRCSILNNMKIKVRIIQQQVFFSFYTFPFSFSKLSWVSASVYSSSPEVPTYTIIIIYK